MLKYRFLHTLFLLSVLHLKLILSQSDDCTVTLGSGSGADIVTLCTELVVPSTTIITTTTTSVEATTTSSYELLIEPSLSSSLQLLVSTSLLDEPSDSLVIPSLSSSLPLSLSPSMSLSENMISSSSIVIDVSSSFMDVSSSDVGVSMSSSDVGVFMSSSNVGVSMSSSDVDVTMSSSNVGVSMFSSEMSVSMSSSEMGVSSSVIVGVMSSSLIQSSPVVPSSTMTLSSSLMLISSSILPDPSSLTPTLSVTFSFQPLSSSLTSSLPPSSSSSLFPSPTSSSSLTGGVTTTTVTSTPPTVTPTGSPAPSIFDRLKDLFRDTTIVIVVAVGGFVILLLICIIITVICYCCCSRRKNRYSIEKEHHRYSNGNIRGTRYRPSISAPQQSYQQELRQVKEERQRLEVFAETELGDVSIDDTLHYQGHSQVQHSQIHNGSTQEITGITTTTQQSLSKLTPLNPSQIIIQAGKGISVDDEDVENELPEQEHSQRSRDPRENGGGDSPFMHLSDNLPPSRTRSQTKLLESGSNPDDNSNVGVGVGVGETSQVSYLGLGVMHGSDVVFTNSMADDNILDLSMVGINKNIKAGSHSASNLIESTTLDDKPTKVSSRSEIRPVQDTSKGRELALLTSLESSNEDNERPVRGKVSSPQRTQSMSINRTNTLSAMTSLPTPVTPTSGDSDLQETPERQRRHTVSTPDNSFRRSSVPPKTTSRLGKLTSLEYIRASLRVKLKRMKAAKDDTSPENPKKHIKSALRKSGGSASSFDSLTSPNTFINRHASEYEESPRHFQPNSPQFTYPLPPPHHHHHPQGGGAYMPPTGPYHDDIGPPYDPMGGAYIPPPGIPPLDPYGYPVSPAHMIPGPMYSEQLSPILSVSQFDYHPSMQVGLLPQYGHPGMMNHMGGGYGGGDTYYPSQPPNYDDEEDEIPFRQNHDMNVSASQRNVTWNLQHQEIPPETPVDPEDVSLTLSDEEDNR